MFKELKDIYSNKRVFLTGHTGFKGAWMLKTLSMLGAEVMGYALTPKNDFDLYNLLNGDELNRSVISDLRNRRTLTETITNFQPDFVFHLAAQPLVRLSYEIPSETFEVNAIGTANVLDAVKALKKQCHIVLITTDKVYHNEEWIYPYRECDRLGGYDPYSASKACTELVIDSYKNSFFNKKTYQDHQKSIAVGRAGNVIGGGDWAKDRLIPDIARALGENRRVIIRNPNAVRPWQHVLEPVIAYLLLGARLTADPIKFSTAYNFGPDATDTLLVSEMVKLAIESWGSGGFELQNSDKNPHEAGLLKLDISKAIEELNWRPKYIALQAIEKTVEWYKFYLNNPADIDKFTEDQIVEYLNL